MKLKNITNRWHAFLIHLGLSVTVFLALLAIILRFWYPNGLIVAGGIEGVKIVAGVDVILGPILTLIVFNTAKKSLKWDLTAIAVFQISALAVGIYIIYTERPIMQVLSDDAVILVTDSEMAEYNISTDTAPKEIFSGRQPYRIFLDLPEDRRHSTQAKALNELIGETPMHFRSELFKPFEGSQTNIKTRLNFFEKNEKKSCYLMPVISKHLGSGSQACFHPDKGIVEIVQ